MTACNKCLNRLWFFLPGLVATSMVVLSIVGCQTRSLSATEAENTPVPLKADHIGIAGLELRWKPVVSSERDNLLDLVEHTGAGWVREDLRWDMVLTKNGSWDFAVPDAFINDLNQRGLQPLLILNNDHKRNLTSHVTADMDGWLNFVRTTVARYKEKVGRSGEF